MSTFNEEIIFIGYAYANSKYTGLAWNFHYTLYKTRYGEYTLLSEKTTKTKRATLIYHSYDLNAILEHVLPSYRHTLLKKNWYEYNNYFED